MSELASESSSREWRLPPATAAGDGMMVITGAEVMTMSPSRDVLHDATIAVSDGRIVAVGHDLSIEGAEEIDARGCVVMPGMVNAHQHTTADPLVRSTIPDTISAEQSIFDWIVPLHATVTGDDDELSATLTAVESLSRGVTTLLEAGTVAHPLRVAAGLRKAGIRGRVGRWGWDTPDMPYAMPVAETLAAQEETVRTLGTTGLVTGWVTLVGHNLASDELYEGAAALAGRLDAGLTLHMSPGPSDALAFAERPIVHLRKLGVLGPRLVIGHAVWLDDSEVDALIETGTAVAACPAAYLRLGQGISRAGRHAEFYRRGGRLALGCDSHNAGDVPDVLRNAWLLAGLDRDRGGSTSAADALAVATVDGAAAVGLGEVTGSIEVGKAADLVVLDTRELSWVPRGDLAMQLVWGGPHRVRDVLVDGSVVVRDGRITTVDIEALRAEAATRSVELLRRAGMTA